MTSAPWSVSGKVAIVTGANSGIGRITARELAKQGAHVFLACRNEGKTRPVVDEIKAAAGHDRVEYLPLDLADFGSIRRSAELFLARDLPLHLLVNNAGLAGQRGLTPAGFELAFGVDHVGPFLFTNLLLDRLRASAPARIVNVASRAHVRARGIDFEAVRKPTRYPAGLPEYSVAKLANVLFSAELARRLEGTGVTTYALHPGVVATDIWRSIPAPFAGLVKLFMITEEEGAKTSLHCSTAPELASETGLYYDACKVKAPSKVAQDRALAAELWTRSEAWTAA